jgi:hypothetical protein
MTTDYSYLGTHDLPGKTAEDFARILGSRADGFTLFLGPATVFNELNWRAKDAIPFVKVHVDVAFFESVRNAQAYCRDSGMSEVVQWFNGTVESRAAVTTVPEFAEHRWSLHVNATECFFKATVRGRYIDDKGPLEFYENVLSFRSISLNPAGLLEYLDASLDPALANIWTAHKSVVGNVVLLAGAEQHPTLEDGQFSELVANRLAEDAAAETAAAMRIAVSETLAAAAGTTEVATPAPAAEQAAPRRRRMGA